MIRHTILGLALLAAASSILAGTSGGSTITVTTAADELNTNGLCSLREAITNANNNNQSGSTDCAGGVDPETILLPAGHYALTIAGAYDDLNLSGDLDIASRLTLEGAGTQATVVDAEQRDRVFDITNGAVTFRQLTVKGGAALGVGAGGRTAGGILDMASGALVLDHVRVTSNTATVGTSGLVFGAGGVYVESELLLTYSEIDHNTATFTDALGVFAGGVSCGHRCTIADTRINDNSAIATGTGALGPFMTGGLNHCALSLTRSRIHGNQASSSWLAAGGIGNSCGGLTFGISRTVIDGNSVTITASTAQGAAAIANSGGSTYDLANLTIVGNTAHSGSFSNAYVTGGLVNDGDNAKINLSQSTFSGNRADGATTNTRALLGSGASYKVANTLFDGDTCENTVTSLGGNLEGPGTGCGLSQVSDQSGVAARGVGSLANNGGETLTLALAPTSPAVDRGDNTLCEAVDQRGVARPLDGDGNGTATCDVGAYEYSDVLFADGFE